MIEIIQNAPHVLCRHQLVQAGEHVSDYKVPEELHKYSHECDQYDLSGKHHHYEHGAIWIQHQRRNDPLIGIHRYSLRPRVFETLPELPIVLQCGGLHLVWITFCSLEKTMPQSGDEGYAQY